ncbi:MULTISPECIES: hypothetical protein [unclassified Streptomyces]|uniref:hypothetical protein n=1 Tax=unclassified Streptomyces TaxID=2593676 RepID=UPI00278BD662|nr:MULTISPECIES: hypothetical protein [unclassified Streptomyces]
MAEGTALGWPERIAAAERAVRGGPGARTPLRTVVAALPEDPELLESPADARQFAYFVAILRDLELTAELDAALEVAASWTESSRVPAPQRCAVHNRLAAVFIDAGGTHLESALTALTEALRVARDGIEVARTNANLAVCAAELGKWPLAGQHAQRGVRLSRRVQDPGPRLELLLRATSVLFLAHAREDDHESTRRLALGLEELCEQQIDRWGENHPRALEPLAVLASTRHHVASLDGDLAGMERLTDVLAVAAQRASTTLGRSHPQAKAVRSSLTRAHAATRRARAAATRAAPPPVPEHPVPKQPAPKQPAPRQHIPRPHHAPDPLILELLVHGIDGATPERMLGDPSVVQTGGDDTAGLYRRDADVDAESRPEDYAGRPVPEAYGWARLAPGNPGRVLWFLLLPFMAVNLAHWMRPPVRFGSRTVRAHGLLVRLAALSLTVMVVAAVCALSMDLIAWQCAGTPACAEGQRLWLEYVSVSPDGPTWWGQPGRRLALGALAPCGFIYLLWLLSRQTWEAYESQRPPVPETAYEVDAPDRPALARPGFWYGRRLVSRLTAMHTAAGLLVVALMLCVAPLGFDRGPGGPDALLLFGVLLTTASGGGMSVVVYVVCRRARSENRIDQRLDAALVRAVPLAAIALVLLAAGYAGWSRPGWVSAGRLPGSEVFSSLGQLVQGLIVVALALTGRLLRRRTPGPRTPLAGLAPAAVVMLACFLYNMLAGGAAQGLSDWLTGYRKDSTIPGPTAVATWQMTAIPLLLGVVLLLTLFAATQLRLTTRRLIPLVREEHWDAAPDALRERRIAGAMARARLPDSVPALVAVLAVAVALLTSVSLVGAYATGVSPSRAAADMSALLEGIASGAQTSGSLLIAGGVLLFLNSGRRASHNENSRGLLRVLWDLGTFWPRAAHPFARLSYSERAVPDLAWRMAAWSEEQGGRILVSAHSQGSVLAVAALWQLSPAQRRHVQLLTYGSPLDRLHGRLFPAYFGPQALAALHREVGGWRNLWRDTDPIGGPIRLTGDDGPLVDRRLKDPLTYDRTTTHPLPTPIRAHFDYPADPTFAEERARLLAWARPQLPAAPRPSLTEG